MRPVLQSMGKLFAAPSAGAPGWVPVGMQVKILTRTMKVKSEHHKFSGSSSAKAHRVRAANLPSHRLSEIQRSEVLRSAGGKLSPIEYSCQRKPASINETIISHERPLARENVLDEMLHNLVPSTHQIRFVR